MNKKKFSKSEVFDLIEEVTTEFGEILAKSEEGEKEIEPEKKDEKKDEKKKEDEKEEVKEEDKELAKCGEMSKTENFEAELKKLYGSMEKSELQVHLDVIKSLDAPAPAVTASVESEEVKMLKNENAELKKGMDKIVAGLEKAFTPKKAPAAKAVTEIGFMGKNEGHTEIKEVSVKEVESVLMAKSQNPNTTSAEREAINDYYLNGRNINSIKHLLGK